MTQTYEKSPGAGVFFYIHDKVTAHGHTLRDTITTRISIERSDREVREQTKEM